MSTLLVFATAAEAAAFTGKAAGIREGTVLPSDRIVRDLSILITGPGMVATAFHTGRALLQQTYNRVINAGVCGSYRPELMPGTVVNVSSDCFADFGAEDDGDFLTAFDIGLAGENTFPFNHGLLLTDHREIEGVSSVNGITVNKATGSESSLSRMKKRFNPDVESMEGAAFIYTCRLSSVPCMQIRSISNFVEKRNRSNWKLNLAIDSLSDFLQEFLNKSPVP